MLGPHLRSGWRGAGHSYPVADPIDAHLNWQTVRPQGRPRAARRRWEVNSPSTADFLMILEWLLGFGEVRTAIEGWFVAVFGTPWTPPRPSDRYRTTILSTEYVYVLASI